MANIKRERGRRCDDCNEGKILKYMTVLIEGKGPCVGQAALF